MNKLHLVQFWSIILSKTATSDIAVLQEIKINVKIVVSKVGSLHKVINGD